MVGQFEIFGDSVVGFRFRLTGGDGVLVISGRFDAKAEAVAAIAAVRENAASGHIVDQSARPLPSENPPPSLLIRR
ncbi:DUF1508 domain-containing protein [Arthrobacter monumenti]